MVLMFVLILTPTENPSLNPVAASSNASSAEKVLAKRNVASSPVSVAVISTSFPSGLVLSCSSNNLTGFEKSIESFSNTVNPALVSGTNIKTVGGASLLGSGDVGTIGLAYGGTGATTASGARTALGLGTAAVLNAGVVYTKDSLSAFAEVGYNLDTEETTPAIGVSFNF